MTPYQRKQQRRRELLSLCAALLLHLLLIGGVLLYHMLFAKDISDFSGPVLVKLGRPEGEDLPLLPDKKPVKSSQPPSLPPPALLTRRLEERA